MTGWSEQAAGVPQAARTRWVFPVLVGKHVVDRRRSTRDPSAGSTAGAEARSTCDQVEFAVSVCMAALRVGVVIQMLPAVAAGFHVSPQPGRYLACWIVAVAASIAVSVVSLVRRRPLPTPALYADIALGVLLIIVAAHTIPIVDRMGSWIGWAPGYVLAVAMTCGPLRSLRGWSVGVVMIIVGYLVYIVPAATETLPTVIGNVLGYAVLAGTVRLVIIFVRRISREADLARAEVARLARREEEHRAQLAFHDATAVMQLLANPALPDDLRAELQTQAGVEVQRMRRYLRGDATSDIGRPAQEEAQVDLSAAVSAALEGFGDLPLDLRLAAVQQVQVDRGTSAAVSSALATVLHNVRQHAGAASVIITGDLVGSAGRQPVWTIAVADDGRGFDPRRTELGVGLRCQVIDELDRHQVRCRIESEPGRGTRVEVTGRAS